MGSFFDVIKIHSNILYLNCSSYLLVVAVIDYLYYNRTIIDLPTVGITNLKVKTFVVLKSIYATGSQKKWKTTEKCSVKNAYKL